MEEASAAKLEELHLGAVSEGEEWLSRALYGIGRDELRVLATAAGVETRSGNAWLPVAELRNSLMKVLATSMEVGCKFVRFRELNCRLSALQKRQVRLFFLFFSRSRVTMIPLHLVQVSCGAG